MTTMPSVAPGNITRVLDRISSLGGRAAIGPTFEQMLEAADANRTGPVIELPTTTESTGSASSATTSPTAATSSAWPSVQAAAATTLGGYAGLGSSTLDSLGTTGATAATGAPGLGGLDGTQMPADASWTAGLPEAAGQWVDAITEAAQRNDVDPRLLAALVWSESGFRADAVSGAGARGLAQLMPGTAAGMGIDPNDPLQNLEGGARYLRAGLDRFGTPELALAAYNAGPGSVERYGGIPPFPETQRYVPIVLDRYRQLGGLS